jgi:thioredoxin family protein
MRAISTSSWDQPRAEEPFLFECSSMDSRRAGHGSDVDEQGNGTVTEQRLYQLIRQSGPISDRQFEIEFLDSGVEAFAFTFG